MPSYEELKSELLQISEILEKFPEQVKPQVFELLVNQFLGLALPPDSTDEGSHSSTEQEISISPNPSKTKSPKTDRGKKTSTKESYSIDRDLNLRGDKSIPSFKDFYNEKKPTSSMQFNAVSIYYLVKILGLDTATLNHAFTCYSEVGKKPPKAFKQSFTDTKNREGWIEFGEEGNLNIPHRGVVYVEHDLPKSAGKSKEE